MLKSQKIIKAFATTPFFFEIGPKVTTSNRICPIYPDMRKTLGDPRRMRMIVSEIVKFIKSKKIKFDVILGGVTAGIPLATALGMALNKPFGYVRKEPKPGGLSLAVEGNYRKGMAALLVDDALGHGVAKKKFIKNIRTAGLKVNWVIVPLSRTNCGRSGRECIKFVKDMKVKFQSFGDIYDINNYALKYKLITPEAANLLKWYAEDAEHWNLDKKKWQHFQKYLRGKHASITGV
ncbi:MAG: hypothetical protein HY398_01575 [Candidatus Doudnabacteria bacterium]|nr:hypothetical protein [Candidatus Doudnabacteria bacterium]